jgi:hypothetical protein
MKNALRLLGLSSTIALFLFTFSCQKELQPTLNSENNLLKNGGGDN